MTLPALPATEVLTRRLSGSPLLLMLDVDGTLAPISPTPSEARVPDATRRVVSDLVAQPDVFVAVVSGRRAFDALRVAGLGEGKRGEGRERVWVIGNHGMEVVDPAGERCIAGAAAPYAADVARAAERLEREMRGMPGVLLEDKGITLSVHYRLADRALVEPVRRMVERVAGEFALRVMTGKEVLELRPPVDIDKGTAAVALAERLGFAPEASDFSDAGPALSTWRPAMLYAGDDRTDEDAFRLLRERFSYAVTVLVGEGATRTSPTGAEYFVRDPDSMRELLVWVREVRRGTGNEERGGREAGF